jgi:hypothetical protein
MGQCLNCPCNKRLPPPIPALDSEIYEYALICERCGILYKTENFDGRLCVRCHAESELKRIYECMEEAGLILRV